MQAHAFELAVQRLSLNAKNSRCAALVSVSRRPELCGFVRFLHPPDVSPPPPGSPSFGTVFIADRTAASSILPAGARMHSRSMRCCICRTLPGQVCSDSARTPDSVSFPSVPKRTFERSAKYCASSGISPCRSRSGRYLNRHRVEAIPKIFPELAFRNQLREILVRGRNHAYIDRPRPW